MDLPSVFCFYYVRTGSPPVWLVYQRYSCTAWRFPCSLFFYYIWSVCPLAICFNTCGLEVQPFVQFHTFYSIYISRTLLQMFILSVVSFLHVHHFSLFITFNADWCIHLRKFVDFIWIESMTHVYSSSRAARFYNYCYLAMRSTTCLYYYACPEVVWRSAEGYMLLSNQNRSAYYRHINRYSFTKRTSLTVNPEMQCPEPWAENMVDAWNAFLSIIASC